MKQLCHLQANGKIAKLVELPETTQAITVFEDKVFLTDPPNGVLYCWEKQELAVIASELEGIHGIHAEQEHVFIEGGEHLFYSLRLFDLSICPFISQTTRDIIGTTTTNTKARHPRNNGLCYDKGDLFFAYPERHQVYWISEGGIKAKIGNGKQGFALGDNTVCSFASPNDVAIINNRIFISDTSNHVIREFTLDLKHSKIIGCPKESGRVDDLQYKARLCFPTELSPCRNNLFFLDDQDSIRVLNTTSLVVNTLHHNLSPILGLAADEHGGVFFVEKV
jgi:hypothetical protein